ncbi:MAG TPA: ATP-binding cassette domain-containing protein [Pyrinomonadaceae bacterium]|nr:ATP-binding cassette domain-containing protein [Pyrinomonadaceae bacterium]
MLELKNITKHFGAVLANDHVNLKVQPGTIHAIVGENGAGKSTAMRIAYGFYRADQGEILVDGQVRDIASPHDAIALGIGMVHQHFMLVDTMTVAENIVLGAEPGSGIALDLANASVEIRKLSEEFKLAVNPNAVIESLSVGQQQRVELLKALYRHARLLILDEPTAVLTPQEVDEFFSILRRMREQGKTVVIITHKLAEVLAISDEVTVMRDGRVVGQLQTKDTHPFKSEPFVHILQDPFRTTFKPKANLLATRLAHKIYQSFIHMGGVKNAPPSYIQSMTYDFSTDFLGMGCRR